MRENILSVLATRPVLADGAMGSQLLARGLGVPCLDALNLDNPDAVRAVHQAYLEAGAACIETNTFGANRLKLARCHRDDDTVAINRQGAALARACAGSEAWVAGAMGPLGRLDEEALEADRVAAVYAEQAQALEAGGVDLLILETFSDFEMLLLALRAVKAAASVPVAAQMVSGGAGFDRGGRTVAACLALLRKNGADIVGFNCGLGPKGACDLLRQVGPVDGPVSVFPNAGFPERRGDRLVYPSSPDYFAHMLLECAANGARLLGGCCGTGPEHIRALRQRLDALGQAGGSATRLTADQPAAVLETPQAATAGFAAKLGQRPLFLVELDPPKHLDVAAVLDGAAALAEQGVDAITLAENPLAAPRLSNIALAHLIRSTTKAEVIVHLTGRDRNLIGMQSTLMGLACLGLDNVLAVTGDPPSSGGEERLSGVYDVRSAELIALLQGFNNGRNAQGQDMRRRTRFCIGAAFNPNTRHIAMQVRRLERKAALGATYFLTQPVYAKEKVDEIVAAVQDVAHPIFLGIMPLVSLRNAEFLHNEFPGITIPEAVRDRLRAAKDGAEQEGLEIAWEVMEYALPHFAGIYLIPPFNRVRTALELLRRARAAAGRPLA